jgi:hypothetical protein
MFASDLNGAMINAGWLFPKPLTVDPADFSTHQ